MTAGVVAASVLPAALGRLTIPAVRLRLGDSGSVRAQVSERAAWLRAWLRQYAIDSLLDLPDRMHLILGLDQDVELGAGRGSLFSSTFESATQPGIDGCAPWLVRTASGWTVRAMGRRRFIHNGEAHPGQLLCYSLESPKFLQAWRVQDPRGAALSPTQLLHSYLAAVASWTDLDFLLPALVALDDRCGWQVGARRIELTGLARQQLAHGPTKGCFGAHWWWSLAALSGAAAAHRLPVDVGDAVARELRTRLDALAAGATASGEFALPSDASIPRGHDDLGARVSYVGHTLAWALKCRAGWPQHTAAVRRAVQWLGDTSVAQAPLISLAPLCHACHALRLAVDDDGVWETG